jgi:serine/threonine protein phosphatase PrpC
MRLSPPSFAHPSHIPPGLHRRTTLDRPLPRLRAQTAPCYKIRLRIEYGTHTDQGRTRTSNEDSFAASARSKLFLVADGMGGHAAGEIASQMAATAMEQLVANDDEYDDPEERLRSAALGANTRVYESQAKSPELSGMGSTLTALSFHGRQYYIVHVGDSRAYLLREGVLDQLTRDHSLVWHLYESGVLRKDELSSHPQKNLITRSIGPHAHIEVDLERGEAREGDVYLLCSDGLSDVVSDEEIRDVLSSTGKSPQEMSETLVQMANEAGGPDNITAVVVRLAGGNNPETINLSEETIRPHLSRKS